METHVKEDAAPVISRYISPHFNWFFNYEHHHNGRIWVGFDPIFWNLTILHCSAQQISCSIRSCSTNEVFVVSFIYGLNTSVERRALWNDLVMINQIYVDDSTAWCLSGDFNVCLGPPGN